MDKYIAKILSKWKITNQKDYLNGKLHSINFNFRHCESGMLRKNDQNKDEYCTKRILIK
jgi:hypothetical protein